VSETKLEGSEILASRAVNGSLKDRKVNSVAHVDGACGDHAGMSDSMKRSKKREKNKKSAAENDPDSDKHPPHTRGQSDRAQREATRLER